MNPLIIKINNFIDSRKFGIFVVLLYTLPLVINSLVNIRSSNLDWQFFEQRYEAIVISILRYGQIPGNNPWSGGGTPIINAFYGIFGLFSIIFGVKLGLKIAILFYYVLGYFGAYNLSILLNFSKRLSQFLALYFVLSNSMAWHLYAGHIIFINILLLPLLIYLSISIENKYNSIIFGLILGIAFIDGPLYTGQYIIIIITLLNFYLILNSNNKTKKVLLYLTSYLLFFAVSSYLIFMLYPYFIEFPRIVKTREIYHSFIDSISLISTPSIIFQDNIINSTFCSNTHENVGYLGISLISLILFTFYKTRKYYLLIPLALSLMPYIQSNSFLSIYYYLDYIPGFSSHLCISRIRLILPLIVGFFVIYFFKKGFFKNLKLFNIRINENIIIFIILSDLFIFSSIPIYSLAKSNNISLVSYNNNFKNIESPGNMQLLELTRNNIGVLSITDSNIPLNKVSRISTSANYMSEFLQNNEKIEAIYWSPNIIRFKSLKLDCIDTNIPYSSGWKLNGQLIPGNTKIIDMDKTMCIQPNELGQAEITWERPFHKNAIYISIAFFITFCTLFIVTNFKLIKLK